MTAELDRVKSWSISPEMARTALYAGSFDPVTNGHLDVVRQAAGLCDRLVLAIGVHPGKTPLFSADERLAMLNEVCGPVASKAGTQLACVTFDDLVITAAQREKATVLIRGLRDSTDFDYEMQMAGMNGAMAPAHTDRLPARKPRGAPDHRHFGAPDRQDGRQHHHLRAGAGRGPAESQIRRQIRRLRTGSS